MLWALGAAFPRRSPVDWAPFLDIDPDDAAVTLARVRTYPWFSWDLVTEAMAIMIEASA
jgi:hypothetical protein